MYVAAEPPLTLRSVIGLAVEPGAGILDAFPADRTDLCASGRDAFARALKGLEVRRDARVLLPAYLCRSLLPPLRAAGIGWRLYAVDRSLAPRLDAIRAGLKDGADAVVLLHYFGAPGPANEVAGLCREFGAALIEDAVHMPVPRTPVAVSPRHASIYSFAKWLAVPNGGAVIWQGQRPAMIRGKPAPAGRTGPIRLASIIANTLECRTGVGIRLRLLRVAGIRHRWSDRDESGMRQFGAAMSPLVRHVLTRTSLSEVIGGRRGTYARLERAVRGTRRAKTLFPELPGNVVPFTFPLLVEDRDAVLARLQHRGINARVYWERLPSVAADEDVGDAPWVSRRMLCLPVHQGLSDGHVAHMADELEALG